MSNQRDSSKNDSGLAPGERPTLKTISRISGLAVATVSRALLDAPDIGQKTKQRVREIADQVGYRPNRAGVRLRTGKTNVVSLVLSTDHEMTNQHTGRLISSIAGELRGTPYHLIVTPYFPTEDPMQPVEYVVETQSADAIILNQTEPDDPRVKYLLEHNFPFATHGRTNQSDQHSFYDFDNKHFGEIGIELFKKRDRKSVLLVAPPIGQAYAQHLIDGASGRAKELGLKIKILQGATSDSETDELVPALHRHLDANPDVDAIICPSTISAMTIVSECEGRGLTIGKDMDLFGKEAIAFLNKFRPGILCINEDVATAGKFLAKAVLDRIKNPTGKPMQGLEVPQHNEICHD